MTTGEKIAALRKEQGMSQEALGEKLGLSRQAVSKWEADQAVPTMDNLMELASCSAFRWIRCCVRMRS